MLEVGWDFDVLPWQVDLTWPTLAEFGQRALNASNSVATDATEWEVAITIAEVHAAMDEPSWEAAMGAAKAGNPACADYISDIKKLVEEGGGSPPHTRTR